MTAAAPTPTPLFILRDVSQERGGRVVLNDLTLDLPPAQFIALIGPSGAGKSSLIRLLNRLDDPAHGEVQFQGVPISTLPPRALRRRVGFVFQQATMFGGTVADNLRAGAGYGGADAPAQTDEALTTLLESVELDASFLVRNAVGLSGGEQQRVSIARALSTSPEVLLLDEPTSALDPEVAERLMATVARLNRDQSLAVVMVTHRLAEARAWSGTTVMLDAGRVVECGPTADLFGQPREVRTRAFVASAG